ncbi:hypothetical protein [Vreelandella titanicae]|uniref:Uncharacterized protein n=1 Tax=Vreelandella titanicae TaxID=664683 RepID=A0A558J0Z0_9GAMM|nr:hypothetical protein [Halomonas titanicae]TVU87321.1 hypothetical protein FQP89_22345 [Halomonas titanicae]
MMTIDAVIHTDAIDGLSWLQLPKQIVKGLGIDNAISKHSYVDADNVYAGYVYLDAKRSADLVKEVLKDKQAELVFAEQLHENGCWIRELRPYSPDLLGDSLEYLEDKLIELPRADELDAATICKFAEYMRNRAQRYCNVKLPEHEWVSNQMEFNDGANEAFVLTQSASFTNRVSLMTESRRGNCEGYVCTAYLTRSLPLGGLVAVPLVSGKFWSWDEADRLSRMIQDWCR